MARPTKSSPSRKVPSPCRARRVRAHFTVGRIKVPVLYPFAVLSYGALGDDSTASVTITLTIHGRAAFRVFDALTKTPSS